jgi:hypothetical protein
VINTTNLIKRMALAKAEGRQADLERMHRILTQALILNNMR